MIEPIYNDNFSFSYKRRKSTRVYDYDNFLTQLKKALMVSEITQGEISRKLGVGRNTVSMWMSGKNKIPMDKAFKIMEMMDFPANYYFDAESFGLPFFAHVRGNILNNKISPYADFRIGYSPLEDVRGFYMAPSIGCKIYSFNVSLGYVVQKVTDDYYDITVSSPRKNFT